MNRISASTPIERPDVSRRQSWDRNRAAMEAELCDRPCPAFRFFWFRAMVALAEALLRLTGLYQRGVQNALDIQLNRIELGFPNLPPAFDGFNILHVSDLHFAFFDGIQASLSNLVAGEDFDLCVITGDFAYIGSKSLDATVREVGAFRENIRAGEGVLGILGNHDSRNLVGPLEELGVQVLINETVGLVRNGERLEITGIDDIHLFESPMAANALAGAANGFKIALIHSPEFADKAAEAGYDLYLTGHTHGGQVCLPGGRPVFTALKKFRKFSRGLWRLGGMIGYTNSGAGVSGLPVRFNCPGEAAVITLRLHHD